MDLGNHAGFILASYGLSILVVVGLFAWVILDGRAQRRRLAELEARGVHRRSHAQTAETFGEAR
ncbi:MAG: heme exporter protein CcmD [Hyphomicrobiales bacterium]|nr:heme exporter protein CcmD [Hyphomicrobiales bacterium]